MNKQQHQNFLTLLLHKVDMIFHRNLSDGNAGHGSLILFFCLIHTLISLQSIGQVAIPEIRYFTTHTKSKITVTQPVQGIPVVAKADVVVAGGGISGVMAALVAVNEGKSVIMIESRNYFGQEITATYRCNDIGVVDSSVSPISSVLNKELIDKEVIKGKQVDPGALRNYLLERINEKPAIRVFLYSLPTGVVMENGRVRGVVFSGRDGVQIVLAKAVVDATEDARIAAAAGAEIDYSRLYENRAHRFIAFDHPVSLLPGSRQVDPSFHLLGDSITIHQGILELAVPAKLGPDLASSLSRAHALTLEKLFAIKEPLKQKGVELLNVVPAPETWFEKVPIAKCPEKWDREKPMAGSLQPAGCKGVLVAGRTVDSRFQVSSLMDLITVGILAGKKAVQISLQSDGFIKPDTGNQLTAENQEKILIKEITDGIEPGVHYPVITQGATEIPVSGEYDVLVAGGGTSGAFAAIAAAREGVKVVLVEILPNLGGISTNRVNGYYWGVPWKSFLRQEVGERIQLKKSVGSGPLEKVGFSGEDKKFVLQDLAIKAGVTIMYQSLASGTVSEGNAIKGIVVNNASGKSIILAKVVIDATGHAGIAVAGGANYQIGRNTDGFMNEIEHGPMRDPTNLIDISTSYLKYPSYSISLNIRESRRITGDYTVSFEDVIKERQFEDVVCRWRSNYDTHLPTSANQSDLAQDWVGMLGLWRRPILGSIPYRSLLPQGIENCIVAAMAYSTDHDALIGGRMQPDLEHLGEAAGIAAAMACKLNVTPRNVPVAELQAKLVKAGVLRQKDVPGVEVENAPGLDTLHRQDFWRVEREQSFLPENEGNRFTVDEGIELLGTEAALEGMMDLYLEGAKSIPALKPLLESENKAVYEEAAVLLGMLGDKSATPALLGFLKERSTHRFEFKLHNASSRPSVPLYWTSAILLGRLGERAAVPEMISLLKSAPSAEKLAEMQRTTYGSDMFKDAGECPPPLVSFILVALGRIGDTTAIEAIKPFLEVSGPVETARENLDFEISWGIRTNAAWALSRLGNQSGVPTLIGLLNSDQALLRNYSQNLLEKITGKNFGKDQEAWEQWWKFRDLDSDKIQRKD